jgi:hypothetical protein
VLRTGVKLSDEDRGCVCAVEGRIGFVCSIGALLMGIFEDEDGRSLWSLLWIEPVGVTK